MYNFLIRLFVLIFISTNLSAQSIYFQQPQSQTAQTMPSDSASPAILSPSEFRNRVNNLDQQNQQERVKRLEQLSSALPGPIAPPAPKEAAAKMPRADTAPPQAQPIAPAVVTPPPQPAATPQAAPEPQAQPYTPSFQGTSTTSQPPANNNNGGGWNIKY